MTNPLSAGLKAIDSVGKIANENIYSKAKLEADRTSRHGADMTSDNWLSKSIRPMICIWAFLINSVIWIGDQFFGYEVDATIALTAGGILAAAVGFYFDSRKHQKIAAEHAKVEIRRAEDAVKIERLKERQQLRMDKRAARRNRRNNGDK